MQTAVGAQATRESLMRTMYRAHISEKDLNQARGFIRAARETDISSDAHAALLLAAIVCYARPFTLNEKRRKKGEPLPSADPTAEKIDVRQLLGAGAELHDRIVRLRMKAVAHSEAEFNPMAFRDGVFISRPWHPVGAGIDLQEFGRIAEMLHRHFLNRKADLSRVVSGKHLPRYKWEVEEIRPATVIRDSA